MKKVLAILLTVLMIVSMAACAKTDGAAGTTTPATTKGNDSKPADTTPADTTPTEPSLVEAAKAEGELVVYGSCEEEYLAAACENFEKLYGIKVTYQRLSTGEVQAKIEEENGNPSADPTTWSQPRACWRPMRPRTPPIC